MNKVKKTTFWTRLKNAINAFRSKEVGNIQFGMHIIQCDRCEHFRPRSWRDDLLVTAGARAAYMHDKGDVDLPGYIAGESMLSAYISTEVDWYLNSIPAGAVSFDEFIEQRLLDKYGVDKKGENK